MKTHARASHCNYCVLCNPAWNLTDERIKALAEMGGAMDMNFSPFFLLPREETTAGKHATVQTVVDHMDHISELVGTDHMGLGSEYDGIPYLLDGLEDASKILNITFELVGSGYSEGDLKKIFRGNFLQVMGKIIKCMIVNHVILFQ